MSDPETLGNVQAFVNQYAPHTEAQRKAFWKKFRKAANAYAGIQGQRISGLERELAAMTVMFDDAQRQRSQFFREARDAEKKIEDMTAKRDALEEALEKCARIIGPPDCETWADDFEIDAAWEAAQKALATHGKASDATPNLEETRGKLGVKNHNDHH